MKSQLGIELLNMKRIHGLDQLKVLFKEFSNCPIPAENNFNAMISEICVILADFLNTGGIRKCKGL